jgi:trk/ktr system potassium uptake protein
MKNPNFRDKIAPFLKGVQAIIFIVLNIFALINVVLLFMGFVRVDMQAQFQYTSLSIFILIFYLFIRMLDIRKFSQLIYLVPDIIFVLIGLFVYRSERVFQFYLLGRQTYFIIQKQALASYKGKFFDKLSENPPIFVLYSFFLMIFVGTLLLMLPAATVQGNETTLIDALFTSTSATCVTGLIIADTGTHFTLFGQIIILLLIQVGGLGIMTISSAFAIMLGQKLSLKRESLIQNVVGESNKLDMISLVKNILIVTFLFELIGAVLMYFTFRIEHNSTNQAIYYSVFHSVSAFCNAGFSLYPDSFVTFKSNFNINFVITGLIIFGGIGFPVMVDLRRNIANKSRLSRLTLHSKIVITSTIALILIGTIAFFISEYNHEMHGMSLLDRLYTSYFQSVTTRTAGFNTIDFTNVSKGSIFTSIMLMFIGASPGSTGGGIKTTTFVVILVSVLSMIRGNRDVNVFKRKVSDTIIKRVMVLIAVSIMVLSFLTFLLLLIEPFDFEKTVFEAFSAFGTVGLSLGITSLLSSAGKLIIVLLMYLGRVGPLTLIFALSAYSEKSNFTYTEEKISIG